MNLYRVAAMGAVSAAVLAVPASASHSWGDYHWATTGNGLSVRVNSAITSQWATAVNGAVADWEKSNVLSLGNRNPVAVDPKKCSPIAGQVLVCNASYGQRGWLGIANIWLSGGHISQATTRLNDSYFSQARYNTAAWRAFVACQELGHDFGLDHVDEAFDNANAGTCMDYTNDPDGGGAYGVSNEHPNSHDMSMLSSIYSHDDGRTSASTSTNFGIRQVGKAAPDGPPSAPAGDSPAAWGRAIHADGLGRPDVFVKELGGGHKLVTHVFWALETKRSGIVD